MESRTRPFRLNYVAWATWGHRPAAHFSRDSVFVIFIGKRQEKDQTGFRLARFDKSVA